MNTLLPSTKLTYPPDITEERSDLLRDYAELGNRIDIRARLRLIIRTLRLLEKQSIFEQGLRLRALAYHEVNRMDRERLLSDGR